MIKYPEKVAGVFAEFYAVADVFNVLKNERFVRVMFKVIPEKARPYPNIKARNSHQNAAQSGFQKPGVNLFLQLNADSENVRPAVGVLSGKNFCGVVEPEPFKVAFCHTAITSPLKISYKQITTLRAAAVQGRGDKSRPSQNLQCCDFEKQSSLIFRV